MIGKRLTDADVTDIVDYNVEFLNRHSLQDSFFHLSKKDPEKGFSCDLKAVAGNVEGPIPENPDFDNRLYVRLLLGSHLAMYLRQRLEKEFGYTSTCGISTNKTLSKLVGARHKPQAQTTLMALEEEDVIRFMDCHKLRKVPGIGSKMGQLIEAQVTGEESIKGETITIEESLKVTVEQVRSSPAISPGSIETTLKSLGSERGIGSKVWALLHGVDPTEVKEAGDVPSQISIEDTYGGLKTIPQITEQLVKLAYSLIRRLRVDLLAVDDDGSQRWIARPKTIRLSVRSWHNMHGQNYNRASRSGSFPNFVFDTTLDMEHLAERLVAETLLPLLRRLATEKGPTWNLQLINVCATNMAMGAVEGKWGAGRDIANMFKIQDEVLRPWKVLLGEDNQDLQTAAMPLDGKKYLIDEEGLDEDEQVEPWEPPGGDSCPKCGHSIPSFALSVHLRYHDMESA